MPIPAVALAAGVNALGQTINAGAQAATNAANRRWNEKMFNWQRDAALTDWGLQNAYNSPKAQMERYREAGLNPNLIYGQTNDAGSIRSQSPGNTNAQAPQVDLGGLAMGVYDMKIKAAQENNLAEQLKVLQQEQLLKAAQVIETTIRAGKTAVDTELAKKDLQYVDQLKQMSLEVARSGIKKTEADTKFTLDENDRKAAMQGYNIVQAIENILTARKQRAKTDVEISHINQQIKNLQQDFNLRKFDERLQEMGIPRNSPGWWSTIVKWLASSFGGKMPDSELKDLYNSFLPEGEKLK